MRTSSLLFIIFLNILIVSLSERSRAQVSQNFLKDELPQYELGAGVIVLNIPDYPGSNNNRYRVVPFPYYIYRGKYLRADDEGTRARLLSSKSYETGLSFGYNFPVNSGDNPSRVNMPDLDGFVSVGPRFMVRFLTDQKSQRLNLSFATRAVFSSKLSFKNLLTSEGLNFEPRLNYWYRWQNSGTTLYSSLAASFGTSKFTGFFYDVEPQYETSERSRYVSKAGLIQTSLSLGVGQQLHRRAFMFSSLSWRNLDWAANKESPLVETRNNVGLIVGFVWTFYESDEKVLRLQ